jgi:hypothetical protein
VLAIPDYVTRRTDIAAGAAIDDVPSRASQKKVLAPAAL